MTKIEELEQKLNECPKELAEIQKEIIELNELQIELKESKKEGKFEPKNGEVYWYRDVDGDICSDDWSNHIYDKNRCDNTLLFPTKKACERYWRFMDAVKEKSYEFTELDWQDDGIKKWVIEYNYLTDQLRVSDHRYIKRFGLVYFKDKESAQYIIDNFKDELMEFFI